MTTSQLQQAIDKSVNKLEQALTSGSLDNDPYSLAITSYALSLTGRPSSDEAIRKLDLVATEEGKNICSKQTIVL